MKKAIGYVRISKKDQSNFSLSGQREYIEKHCSRNSWELLSVFEDDGQSAKNFDRASWKELEAFVKQHHKQIDYLVVSKFDRFSRNVSEALSTIDKLEKKYGIRIMSVMEPINLHPESPYFFQFRTQMLVGAQVELMVIKDRTKFGLVNAARAGRFVNKAPMGYKNARDERNKPLIVIDEEKAPLIKLAYNLLVAGTGLEPIRRTLRERGLIIEGRSTVTKILKNPLYTGLVHVNKYYDDPEELVEGKHEAIIDRPTWWKAQAILTGRNNNRVVYNEEVPLRGVIRCQCGRMLAAGNSKGKFKYYWYYKCATHLELNFSAITLHKQFDEILEEFSLSDRQIKWLEEKLIGAINQKLEVQGHEIIEKQKELKNLVSQIERLEEKYLTDGIDKETYNKWKIRWENDRYVLMQTISTLQAPVNTIWARYSENLQLLTNIPYLYKSADLNGKHAFIRVVFNNQLFYHEGAYRTPYIIPIFRLKASLLKEKGLLYYEQPSETIQDSFHRSEDGS